ncbi:MAG: cobyric acid synthase [Proteobacteria bacterium]|nr:cobyric acid synthase [Pseudomonadota bacterium]MDA1287394.1 cobyric acid synthase [Pseudomonadota bacterium]
MSKAIMIQGAGSNVGKSLLVAGLCRAYRNRGYAVRPFKPQNMSNNAAVTEDGGEIGRAQALQAVAAGTALVSDLNPVLLKPESEIGSQVILQGKRLATVRAQDYAALKPRLMTAVMNSFARVKHDVDLVIVEGAGSPAEINLRENDIANMGFAEAANVPVILTGDIDRGGVIAQIVGTHAVLPKADRDRIKGFIINKFRGDPRLFDSGLSEIVTRTNWHSIGVVPWFERASSLPAEDVMDIKSSMSGRFKIAVPRLSRIANFDDLDPLKLEPSVSVQIVEPGQTLPVDANLVLIPGTKSTIADLAFFRAQGWDIDLAGHIRRGGNVLGICGGFQMLGREIDDPQGIEGAPEKVAGLGHLDIVTIMHPEKHLANVNAEYLLTGQMLTGYEIHIGKTTGPDCNRPMLEVNERPAGAQSENGRVQGCYLHGMFASDGFRKSFLSNLGIKASRMLYSVEIDQTLNSLAAHLEGCLDLDMLLDIAR